MTSFDAIKKLFSINSSCGFAENDLLYWVEKFGFIPKVLKDYYLELGKHNALNNTQDFLIAPKEFPEYEDAEYLIFYSENQGGILWGINKEDVSKDNPSVYENYGEDEWFPTDNTLYEFLLSMAHLQAVFSLEYGNGECVDITPAQAQQIAHQFMSKHADSGLYTGIKCYGDYDDAVIVVMQNHENYILMYSSSNKEHFDETDRIIKKILSD